MAEMINACREFLARCGLPLERLECLGELRRLYEDLAAANRRDNLTALTDEREFWLKHVVDSFSLGLVVPEVFTGELAVADVGCGAGFPLLPLAWANPRLKIVGIETRRKKVAFIERETAALRLGNCHTVAMQAREAARLDEYARTFDLVLLRAVGTAAKMVRECRNLLAPPAGARMIFYKTPETAAEELPLARREAEKFDLAVSTSESFVLPADAGERQFLILARP